MLEFEWAELGLGGLEASWEVSPSFAAAWRIRRVEWRAEVRGGCRGDYAASWIMRTTVMSENGTSMEPHWERPV